MRMLPTQLLNKTIIKALKNSKCGRRIILNNRPKNQKRNNRPKWSRWMLKKILYLNKLWIIMRIKLLKIKLKKWLFQTFNNHQKKPKLMLKKTISWLCKRLYFNMKIGVTSMTRLKFLKLKLTRLRIHSHRVNSQKVFQVW